MKIFDFESGVPSELAYFDGFVEVTSQQYKEGNYSLKWSFKKGDRLVFKTNIGYKVVDDNGTDNRKHAFSMFLFDFNSEGKLKISFYKGNKAVTQFEVVLGFRGWRIIRAAFERDMQGMPEEDMDGMVITAKGSGSVLMDAIVTSCLTDYRWLMASSQVPYIKKELAPIIDEYNLKRQYVLDEPYNNDISTITERLCEYHLLQSKSCEYDDLMKRFESLDIKEGTMGVTGRPVEFILYGRPECKEGKYVKPEFVANLLFDMAIYYYKTKDERVKNSYILLLKHFITQGFDHGSCFYSHVCLNYFFKNAYNSFLFMKDVIRDAGLDETVFRASVWFTRMGFAGFFAGCEDHPATADDFNTTAQGMLITCLMIRDEIERASYVKAFSDWLDRNMQYEDGLMGIFKEDGCIYHHMGHYLAYGQGGLRGIAPIIYAVSCTAFDISKKAWLNMKNVLEAIRFQCNKTHHPIVFSGRHPLGIYEIELTGFKYFALSALEKGDKEPVAVYLRLMDRPSDYLDEKLKDSGVAPESAPQGNRTFYMACANVQRRREWLVAVKGFSKYLWGSEIYLSNNLYGRYRSYGAVEILGKPDLMESGFSHSGYDWRRIPGTTAICLPYEQLRAKVYNVDQSSGFEEMLLSDQSFAGGNTLGDNGMFSMILTEHPKYNGTHKAYKSVFFKDDFILLVGSGISNNSPYETETTLFQNSILEGENPPLVNGKSYSGVYVTAKGDVITDNKRHCYYVREGTNVLLQSGMQAFPESTGKGEAGGLFALGTIRHGTSPSEGSYEYGIGVNGAAKKEYKILQQDTVAHIAEIENTTYMAIFEPEKFGMVKVNVPIMLMYERKGGKVEIAVCNPDLGLYTCDPTQYDENGIRKEVSIYSREWAKNPIKSQRVTVKIPGLNVSIDEVIKGGRPQVFTVDCSA